MTCRHDTCHSLSVFKPESYEAHAGLKGGDEVRMKADIIKHMSTKVGLLFPHLMSQHS